ncbi:YebG family protein [Marinomonas sp. IMCC 4694]|uniref:YebG family protein n=1 Tax=Marinomonas sp. IMCC 4694 TaxID=2605432 RepID=UPI0011E872E3|nr:YebG family protein [Marinomonas sp. IMCC 4694]TYL48772.1 hypothetical protein FXV75_13070 [Marinomonas sp. IMCC 4694]
MPVIINYVVERDGIEKMTFTSKTDADAYDKLLDTADALYEVLAQSDLAGDHSQKEALSMYLAQQKDVLLDILSSKKKATPKAKKTNTQPTQSTLGLSKSSPKKALEDLIIETDEDATYTETEDDSSAVFDDEITDYIESDAA